MVARKCHVMVAGNSHRSLCPFGHIYDELCTAAPHLGLLLWKTFSEACTALQRGRPCEAERWCSLLQPSPDPMPLHSPDGQREHLSFRQGPSKRFFETAEGLEQGEPRCTTALPPSLLHVTGSLGWGSS